VESAVAGLDGHDGAVGGRAEPGRVHGRLGVVGLDDAAPLVHDLGRPLLTATAVTEGAPGDADDGAGGEEKRAEAREPAFPSSATLPRRGAAVRVGGYWLVLGLGSGAAGLHACASYGASSRAR